jgi:hypothetical protein
MQMEGNNRYFLRKLDGTGSGCRPEAGSCERSYTNYVVYDMEIVNAHFGLKIHTTI